MGNNFVIAAERRRRIYDLILRHGSVSVSQLAKELGVVENTVRRDLDSLHRDGRVIRSHGGASVKTDSLPSPPYSQMKDTHLEEKALIASAAIDFLPAAGSIFINSGITTNQMALRMPRDLNLNIYTNSPEISVRLAGETAAEVYLIGGRIIKESMETDGGMSDGVLSDLFWDTAFMGIWALDLEHGITSTSPAIAAMERKVIENSKRVIGLCDSWKLGRFAHARVKPMNVFDVLITDQEASEKHLKAFRDAGIQVVIAGDSK